MADRVIGRRTIRQHDLVHEGFEIGLVFAKALDIAFFRIAERALRQPLPAPVHGRDREAARPQFARGLVIFLDELRAALEDADRALAARRRRPAREPQIDPVWRLQRAGDHVLGHRIGGDGNEFHWRTCA